VPVFGTGAEHLDDDVWEIMKPADFFEFAIPFEMSGDTEVWSAGLLLPVTSIACASQICLPIVLYDTDARMFLIYVMLQDIVTVK